MIGLVTDSNSQIPRDLVDRYGVEVVPMTVIIDGSERLEGVDLDVDEFYGLFGDRTPEVSTSQPGPGLFASAYERLSARGCESICSVHIGSELSGTINSARVGARQVDVPVTIVDTGTVSFGITCAVWAAAKVIEAGGTLEHAVTAAEAIVPHVASVFVLGARELAKAGGRVAIDDTDGPAGDGEPVYALKGSDLEVIGQARDLDGAADVMAGHIAYAADQLATGGRLAVAVGAADQATLPFWGILEERVRNLPSVTETIRYRVGPSVGVHSGPGTVGAFYFPAGSAPE